jgi:hypothetical protein
MNAGGASGSSTTVGSTSSSSSATTSSTSTGSGGASGSTGGATGSGGAGGLGGAAGSGGDIGSGGVGGSASGGSAGSGGDVGTGGTGGSGVVDAGPNPGCNLSGTFPGLNFINTAFVASQYQPDGNIPFKQSACNDAANPFSTVTREAGATGSCFAGQIDVTAAKALFTWVAVGWLHYDANYNKGYPDPYPVDPMKNPGTDSICLAKKVVIKARASVDNLLITFAAGDPGWEGVADMVILKKDTWTEVSIPLSGWVQLPIMRGFYFNVGMVQSALDNVTGPIQFFIDSGAYQQ